MGTGPSHQSGLGSRAEVESFDLSLQSCSGLQQSDSPLSVETVAQAFVGETPPEQIARSEGHHCRLSFKPTETNESIESLIFVLVF